MSTYTALRRRTARSAPSWIDAPSGPGVRHFLIPAAIGGGMALGGLGSFLGAQAANRASRRQLEGQQQESSWSRGRIGSAFFGRDNFNDMVRASGDWIMGNYIQAPRNQAQAIARISRQPSILDQMRDLGSQYVSNAASDLDMIRRNSASLDQMAQRGEQAVMGNFGLGEARAREESRLARESADDQAAALLGRFGGGGTLLTNQMAANRRNEARQSEDMVNALREVRLQQLLGEQARRLQLNTGRRAVEEATGQDLSRIRYTTQMDPLQASMNVLQGQAFMPYTPVMGPSQSPIGSALGSLGGGLSMLGMMAAMQPSGPQMNPAMMRPAAAQMAMGGMTGNPLNYAVGNALLWRR